MRSRENSRTDGSANGMSAASTESTVRRGNSSKRARPWEDTQQQHTRRLDMTISASQTKSPTEESTGGNAIRLGRLIFTMSHMTLAFVLAALSYAILANINKEQADVYFESFANLTFIEATSALTMGDSAASTMASLASEIFPRAEQYPMVSIPGFERIAQDLLNSGILGFAPIVKPAQLEDWEKFAYDYYYNKHLPRPFPNTTGVFSFGRGVWAFDTDSTAPDQRYHDLGQNCSFDCSYNLLVPVFQVHRIFHSTEPPDPDAPPEHPRLLYNMHSDPAQGAAVESVLDCVSNLSYSATSYEADTSCAMHLPLSIGPIVEGPLTLTFQPVRPAKNQSLVTGIMFKLTSWDQIVARACARNILGVDLVISDQIETFTYRISGGKVTEFSRGDYHNDDYDSDGRHFNLIINQKHRQGYTRDSATYTLSVYPSVEFYESYDTPIPEIAMIVSLFVMLFISVCFCFYDKGVKRVALERSDFIQARNRFMRFVSHEVRTPLNAVSMGLDVISDAIEAVSESLRRTDPHLEMAKSTDECIFLVKEVRIATQQSVDVLSDVLNYEKIERRDWIPDCRLIPMWEFLENSSDEFLPRATEKKIYLQWIVCKPEEAHERCKMGDVLESNGETPETNGETPSSICNNGAHSEADGSAVPSSKTELFYDVEKNFPEKNPYEQSEDDTDNFCLVGDVLQLKQVLHNLIGNSIHFTPELGSIRVKSAVEPAIGTDNAPWLKRILPGSRDKVTLRKFGHLNVTVYDTGAGMSREQQQKLRHRFNPNTLQTGRGRLSLFISKAIVERHGGTFAVKSEGTDRGCAFRVTLPVYQSKRDMESRDVVQLRSNGRRTCSVDPNRGSSGGGSTNQQQPPSHNEESTKSHPEPTTLDKLRLLIVDDAASNRKFLRRLLERKGHVCDEVEDGQLAVDLMSMIPPTKKEKQYDCILMDFQMPEMDGPTATKAIRSLGYDILIIGVTGNLLKEDVEYFLGCGADAVLGKPIHLASLDDLWIKHGLLVPPQKEEEENSTIHHHHPKEIHRQTLVDDISSPPPPPPPSTN